MMKKIICVVTGVGFLTACATTTQLTSGANYLARHATPTASNLSGMDKRVREIASIEPNLQFPARVGLARINHGRLVSIPPDEAALLRGLTEDLGQDYGEFVPISPLIANMVTPRVQDREQIVSVIDQIRLGSARQHLDYVLIYEVSNVSKRKSNALRLTDLTVLGLFVLPSRNIKVDSTASAILMDVRNGYPYGTATAFAQKSSSATVAAASTKKSTLEDKMRYRAVENLTSEISMFMKDLYKQTQSE